MNQKSTDIYVRKLWATIVLLFVFALTGTAQTVGGDTLTIPQIVVGDSLKAPQQVVAIDSLEGRLTAESVEGDSIVETIVKSSVVMADSANIVAVKRARRDWSAWRPNPQRALWLALVFPGGGQIYNRKYWKLPLVYGGFIGCIYAMSWNSMMYKDYQQAYIDIMDDDPNTASYNKFLLLGRQIDSSNIERYKQIFKSRKDKYRRWRDMSFFVLIGVYALSVIDAYVDAELSEFDISKDLSLRVSPAVMGNGASSNPFNATSVGLSCSLNF